MTESALDTATETVVLHWLRIKGLASADDLASLTGMQTTAVEAVLAAALARAHAVVREGRRTTYRLTPDGKNHGAVLLRCEQRDNAAVERLYEAFLPLNEQLKEITSSWQVRDGQPNDHSDRGYDEAVISRLVEVCEGITAVLPAGGVAPARLAAYRSRFNSAVARVQAGEHAAFARPMADSFHDAWMELHQDLLLTLERERSAADGH